MGGVYRIVLVLCMIDPRGVGGCKPPPIWFGITYPEQLCVVCKLRRAGFFSCHDF